MTNTELKRRAERRVNILTEIGNLQEELKALKAEDTAQRHVREGISQQNYNTKLAVATENAEAAFAESHARVEKIAKQKSKREKADA